MTAKDRSCRRQEGFTAFEALVVLAILAVTMAIAAPKFGNSRQVLQLKAAASVLAADLRTARATALKTNVERGVTLDVATYAYKLDGSPRYKKLPRAITIAYDSAPGLRANESLSRVAFRGDGTSSGGIIVLKAAGARATIGIDWLSGSITTAWK